MRAGRYGHGHALAASSSGPRLTTEPIGVGDVETPHQRVAPCSQPSTNPSPSGAMQSLTPLAGGPAGMATPSGSPFDDRRCVASGIEGRSRPPAQSTPTPSRRDARGQRAPSGFASGTGVLDAGVSCPRKRTVWKMAEELKSPSTRDRPVAPGREPDRRDPARLDDDRPVEVLRARDVGERRRCQHPRMDEERESTSTTVDGVSLTAAVLCTTADRQGGGVSRAPCRLRIACHDDAHAHSDLRFSLSA
jgi:hypothetical protein